MGVHLHPQTLQQAVRGARDALGQGRQDARPRLDEVDADVALRVDALQPVAHERAGGLVQLRRQLHARGPGADDGHLQLRRPQGLGLHVGTQAGIHQATVEALRLLGRLQRDGMLGHAWGAEVVGLAADSDDQGVVGPAVARRDELPVLIQHRADEDQATLPVQADHGPCAVAESVPVRLGQVVRGVIVDVDAAGGNLVQVRLPEVRARLLDQRHVGAAALAQPVAQPRHKLQPARAAAHHDDAVGALLHIAGVDLVWSGIGHGGAGVRHGMYAGFVPSPWAAGVPCLRGLAYHRRLWGRSRAALGMRPATRRST